MMLPVSAPFHCALMQPAADAMAEALAQVDGQAAAAFRWSPMCLRSRSAIRPTIVHALVEQVTGTVRWRESISFMAGAGVTTFYEVGSGKVLAGLIKRIAETATCSSIGTPEDVARFKAARGLSAARS